MRNRGGKTARCRLSKVQRPESRVDSSNAREPIRHEPTTATGRSSSYRGCYRRDNSPCDTSGANTRIGPRACNCSPTTGTVRGPEKNWGGYCSFCTSAERQEPSSIAVREELSARPSRNKLSPAEATKESDMEISARRTSADAFLALTRARARAICPKKIHIGDKYLPYLRVTGRCGQRAVFNACFDDETLLDDDTFQNLRDPLPPEVKEFLVQRTRFGKRCTRPRCRPRCTRGET